MQYDFEPPHQEMGRHIASGIFNSGILQTIKVLCQFASVIILSRLLKPDDFGLLAMVSPICGFIALFQDLGLSQATIQKPGITNGEITAFFWINVGVSALLALIIVAISPLIGWYYGEPRLVPLSMAMGALLMGGCLGNQHGAILTRRMQFGVLALNGVLGAISGLVVSIIAALLLRHHNGYWALYYGMIAGTFVPVAGVWIACRWRPGLPKRVPGLSHMLKFGAGLTISSMGGYISGNVDNVLIGHRWGDHLLGFYDRAYKLLLFPLLQIVTPVSNTLVPVLSRLTTDPTWYRSIFLKTIGQLTLAIWPGILWAVVLDRTLVPTLLGRQWADVAPIFVPLALAGMLSVVNRMNYCLFASQGRAGELARWSLFSTTINVIGFVVGLPYGPRGVAISIAIITYVMTPFVWLYTCRRGPVKAVDIARAVLPQAIGAVITALALLAYRRYAGAAPIAFLAGGLVLSYAAMGLAMMLTARGRDTLRQTLIAARRIFLHALGKDKDKKVLV